LTETGKFLQSRRGRTALAEGRGMGGRYLHNLEWSDFMASTNKTANLGLSQWVASDAVEMVDFNEDNRRIEEAMGKRLEWELIMEQKMDRQQDVKVISLDVSGIDFSKYAVIVMSFALADDCQLYLNDRTDIAAHIYRSSTVFGFPFKNSSLIVYLFGNKSTVFNVGGDTIRYSQLTTLNLTKHGEANFTSPFDFKMWGAR